MTFDGYVEIGQDGAGIIETKDDARGLFTYKIESCLIEIFLCMKATILIHDSKQLKLSQIEKLIKKYGAIRQVIFVRRKDYDGRHDERMKKLVKAAGAKNEVLIASVEPFAIACSKQGAVKILPHGVPEGVKQLPESEQRQAVCEVNNCFLKKDAQNLALDIQYVKGEFGAPRAIDKPLPELLEMVKAQPQFFFMNLAVLGNAHAHGVLELPEYLLALYERHDVGRFRSRHLIHEERSLEAEEYKAYVSALT
ncbi:hypothetical protein [Paraburkholderia aspalathi]|uniref:Uncharacterized protein n=1 Tax=Paraburkholderia aspalathi TaxID=1324617 RepID=A0A1I7CEY9_9BURK|nr:hypothetical protein [Paraburkholderia aspalathi]MBK3842649.1 hypothetical protein [Paraburkholderia aspalathi]CAE6824491.1 hypothetical protein R69746_06212 [Paraburkholderia aspalathi]SFT97979.1 hypothetical protein SAMN05192563_1006180 [Paraburkholderia aspalathi]